ncbi:MAG: dihydrodipicolinate synthase family protein, partial [Bacillati bacterium ANGP1]
MSRATGGTAPWVSEDRCGLPHATSTSRGILRMTESKTHWEGVFPSLCTPFGEDGSIDLASQRAVVRFALSCGAHGVFCLGLAGEVNKLTPKERKQLSSVIVEEVNGRVPVLVGVGAESEHTADDLTRCAETVGADGVVAPPPSTARTSADTIERYFLAIAETTHLPVVIQDAPAYLGVALSADLVGRLAARQPNIRYVKLESGPEQTVDWVAHLHHQAHVFTGDAGLHLLTSLRAGAVGNVPGAEVTDLLIAAYNAEKRGDPATADALHARLLPYLVFSLQGLDHYNACSKEMLVRRGILPRGGLRRPASQLVPSALELIEKYFRD